ncbi:SMP-30/gluconolactonase/LRE family protein [Methylobacterium radiodurans]|uniref:Gluconolactonase n=1 Tax=Methylobacterium radiodurans TaxID=2202828 RepID=A0A2U8W0K5_9HYPH|nr:SMP-30/gluconolactonase/LRE family protein [Methylobacterium radiodurans]AWN39171.1 gluconolactonase [Methylobacterium radiodurans]
MPIDRRAFLAGAALPLAAPALAAWEPAQRLPDPAVEVLDPAFAPVRLSLAAVERVATGLRWAEGPVWFGDWNALLLSDVTNDRILRWDAGTGKLSTFRKPANYANGNTRDGQGRLITCQHATRSVVRTEHDGSLTTLADSFDGRRLNSPNDVVCHADGTIWFTDPAFGPNPYEAMAAPELPGNVYRLDPATGALTVAVSELKGPNGLCFAPDGRRLYVIEARAEPNRLIRAYDLADGSRRLTGGDVHVDCGRGTADGMRADVAGNLWCGWGMGEAEDGVAVFSPQGRMIGRIRLPERCANLCFGGPNRNRLLMAATHSVYSLYVNTRGAGSC